MTGNLITCTVSMVCSGAIVISMLYLWCKSKMEPETNHTLLDLLHFRCLGWCLQLVSAAVSGASVQWCLLPAAGACDQLLQLCYTSQTSLAASILLLLLLPLLPVPLTAAVCADCVGWDRLVFLLSMSDVLYSFAMLMGDPDDKSNLCYFQAIFSSFFELCSLG